MIRDHFTKRTNAPQPLILIAAMVWLVALLCVHDGSRPKWAWAMVGMASLMTVYVAARLWLYFGRKAK